MEGTFQHVYCKGQFFILDKYDVVVKGVIEDANPNTPIRYLAAAPADHRATFTGSGLPFANQLQAFENTPNIGIVELDSQKHFEIKLMMPNSYMVGLGSVQVPPTLYLEYTSSQTNETRQIAIQLSEGIPFRSMTYPMKPVARADASFYATQFSLPVRSQERILLDSGYPQENKVPDTFWGLKPPM